MAAIAFYFPIPGTPAAEGYQLSFYESGTDTPQAVYTDTDLLVAWEQPIVLNANGVTDGPIYLTPTPALKVVYTDENDVAISGYPVDGYSPAQVAS